MASVLAGKMGLNSLFRKQSRNFNVRICTMESDMEFSCEVCVISLNELIHFKSNATRSGS